MHPLEAELRALVHDPRLLDFFERAVDGMWMWDLTPTGKSWVTPAFARAFGYAPGEFEQGAAFWQSICHPDDWQAAMAAVEEAVRSKGVYDYTSRIKHKKGHWVWSRSIGIILRDEHGNPSKGFGIAHDITELMEAKERLERETKIDPLTGLLNRRGIDKALQNSINQANRLGCEAYAVLIDLDDFKLVNDSYGHAAGDTVLKETACCLTRSVRVVDEVGRLGGDEFLVFLLARDRHEAEYVAQRIREDLARLKVCYEGQPIEITLSSGLLPVYQQNGVYMSSVETLIKTASPYLQRGKENGKNQVVSPTLPPPSAK